MVNAKTVFTKIRRIDKHVQHLKISVINGDVVISIYSATANTRVNYPINHEEWIKLTEDIRDGLIHDGSLPYNHKSE